MRWEGWKMGRKNRKGIRLKGEKKQHKSGRVIKNKKQKQKPIYIKAGKGNPIGWRDPRTNKRVRDTPTVTVRNPTNTPALPYMRGSHPDPRRLYTYNFSLCEPIWGLLCWFSGPHFLGFVFPLWLLKSFLLLFCRNPGFPRRGIQRRPPI